ACDYSSASPKRSPSSALSNQPPRSTAATWSWSSARTSRSPRPRRRSRHGRQRTRPGAARRRPRLRRTRPTRRRRPTQRRKRRMPKQKTHSGAKKRFKVTGSGKVMKQQAGMRHNLEVKSGKLKRKLNQDEVLAPQDAKVIKKLLGK